MCPRPGLGHRLGEGGFLIISNVKIRSDSILQFCVLCFEINVQFFESSTRNQRCFNPGPYENLHFFLL